MPFEAIPISQLIERAGGPSTFARGMGVGRSTVFVWRKTGIPHSRVLQAAELTGVPAHRIRPDIYSPKEKRASEAA